jgi:DNA-binding HxlR family transcriptional regulator
LKYSLRTDCPVRKSLELVGGIWKLIIINELGDGTKRYGELKRLIPDISEKMLIQELKKLTSSGIISRKSYNEIPPRVEYSLTEKGKKALEVIEVLRVFGEEFL